MKIIKPSVKILTYTPASDIYKAIEYAGRTCYQSRDKITDTSYEDFIKNLIKRKHLSVLEHQSISVQVICDRGVSHELVRHRIAAYSQTSTRYVSYKDGIEVIEPCFWNEKNENNELYYDEWQKYELWKEHMHSCQDKYKELIELGTTPQEARSILPNSLKTEIIVTMNLRSWRHFLLLRCAKTAHPQMREIALLLLTEMMGYLPIIFEDINFEEEK